MVIEVEQFFFEEFAVGLYLFPHDYLVPHLEGLPLPELAEEVERLDPVEAVPFLEPVMQDDELLRVILKVMAEALLADGVVLPQPFLLLLLEGAVVDDLEVVRIDLVVLRLLEIDELVDIRYILED